MLTEREALLHFNPSNVISFTRCVQKAVYGCIKIAFVNETTSNECFVVAKPAALVRFPGSEKGRSLWSELSKAPFIPV